MKRKFNGEQLQGEFSVQVDRSSPPGLQNCKLSRPQINQPTITIFLTHFPRSSQGHLLARVLCSQATSVHPPPLQRTTPRLDAAPATAHSPPPPPFFPPYSAWIFIKNLPYELTEGDVITVFSQYGEVVDINLARDKDKGHSKGFCFLCYEDQRSTNLAVDNFNGIKASCWGSLSRPSFCMGLTRQPHAHPVFWSASQRPAWSAEFQI